MAFTATKDDSGVYLIRIEGQLIVGNRQELKAADQFFDHSFAFALDAAALPAAGVTALPPFFFDDS